MVTFKCGSCGMKTSISNKNLLRVRADNPDDLLICQNCRSTVPKTLFIGARNLLNIESYNETQNWTVEISED